MERLEKFNLGMFYDISNFVKTYKDIEIIKPKAFKERQKYERKNNHVDFKVIRSTSFKKVSQDYLQKHQDEEYLCVQEPSWDKELVYFISDVDDKPFFTRTVGYIPVSNTEFIEVYQQLGFIIWLFFGLGLLAVLFSLWFGKLSRVDDTENSIHIDDSQTEWTGELPKVNGDLPEQENIEIPGFYRFVATSVANSVPLYNPESNTVYFQYSIYEIVDSKEVGTYNTASEAQEFIQANSVNYSLDIKEGFSIVDGDGNRLNTVLSYKSIPSDSGYIVLQERLKAVYGTGMIKPGNQVLWNAYKSLGVGNYMLKFVINTYDIETGGECYGAVQTVEAIVE